MDAALRRCPSAPLRRRKFAAAKIPFATGSLRRFSRSPAKPIICICKDPSTWPRPPSAFVRRLKLSVRGARSEVHNFREPAGVESIVRKVRAIIGLVLGMMLGLQLQRCDYSE